mgnify:CR=1 FL=1
MALHRSEAAQMQYIDGIRPDVKALQIQLQKIEEGGVHGESKFLCEAIKQACEAALKGNYGIGAVVVRGDSIVGRGQNRLGEVTHPLHHVLHAEMDALGNFHEQVLPDQRGSYDQLLVCTTLEPCPMCTCGLFNAGIKTVLAGALDPWAGQLISHPQKMPPLWPELLKSTGTVHRLVCFDHGHGDGADTLPNLCNRIFMITKEALDSVLTEQ